MTPTQRSKAWLVKQGFRVGITERWCSFARVRIDLFGFVDMVAIKDRILAVQTTSGSNVSARVEKIRNTPDARVWLQAGGLIEVHGWRKVGARGKRKTWQVRRVICWLDGEAFMATEVE